MIHVISATILWRKEYEAGQYLVALRAPEVARSAKPGQFVYLRCSPFQLMRRPMSLLWVDAAEGVIEILFRVRGEGTQSLADRAVGEQIDLMGPIGTSFSVSDPSRHALLIGGGIGMPPVVFHARILQRQNPQRFISLFIGSEQPFPFKPVQSGLLMHGIPREAKYAMPLCEELGIPSRLASHVPSPGIFKGYVTALARTCLESLSPEDRQLIDIYACGPKPMLQEAVRLSRDFSLAACEVCMEEYMACAVGGCAGCTIPVTTQDGQVEMKRVCVDGPVFSGYQVFNIV